MERPQNGREDEKDQEDRRGKNVMEKSGISDRETKKVHITHLEVSGHLEDHEDGGTQVLVCNEHV